MTSPDKSDCDNISRRDAIKKSAAAGAAAGLVWSTPRIEGLSMRPNYAAAASAPLTWTATIEAVFGGGVRGTPIQGLEGVTGVSGGEAAFGGGGGSTPDALLAVVVGTGLSTATLTIDSAVSPSGPPAIACRHHGRKRHLPRKKDAL